MTITRLCATCCATLLLCVSSALCEDKAPNAWSREFSPPTELKTERLHLEPLGPQHAEMDHKAFMSSRKHLRSTLHWGNWPADDSTVEGNRKDLERHWKEFENREAYAYTVLTADRKRCVGCVYMKPVKGKPRATGMAYWVVADELSNDLDKHLVKAVLGWIEKDWPLDNVVQPLHTENTRGIQIAKDLGLRAGGPPANDMQRYVWQRGKN